jgi:hypothetical protein
MTDRIDQLRDLIQFDIGKRGLASEPRQNLINACPDDFRLACESLAHHANSTLAVVTGFFIPTATPPAGETDGPLGALFLARALTPLGIRVKLVTDAFCVQAMEAGLKACNLDVPLIALPSPDRAASMSDAEYCQCLDGVTHLLAIERVGPNVDGRCHTMRGRDITDLMSPAHRLFESINPMGQVSGRDAASAKPQAEIVTIGIGDGGNEIGMGKIPRDVIARNIKNGDLVACRTPAQHLIVCGISNWGAYALAAGIMTLRGALFANASGSDLFDPARERQILEAMVAAGPLVDGVTGQQVATVDGTTWEEYADILVKIGAFIK